VAAALLASRIARGRLASPFYCLVQLVREVPPALVRGEFLAVHRVREPRREEAVRLEWAHLVLPLLELRLHAVSP